MTAGPLTRASLVPPAARKMYVQGPAHIAGNDGAATAEAGNGGQVGLELAELVFELNGNEAGGWSNRMPSLLCQRTA